MNRTLSVILEQTEEREISEPQSPSNTLKSDCKQSDRSSLTDVTSKRASLAFSVRKVDSNIDTSLLDSYIYDKSPRNQRPDTDLDKLIKSKIVSGDKCSCTCSIF
ncbi:unnamed protein product [Blepharisma stoltei]|uniref:Uncharacterized protein n=1 Tax=Blepharisma stoltei TaxID=1481888 RepID=A0AAU9IX81_9CILI|nr:unnamed protein product [Blepharisma stoltei]